MMTSGGWRAWWMVAAIFVSGEAFHSSLSSGAGREEAVMTDKST
jgi:hypothetical protein